MTRGRRAAEPQFLTENALELARAHEWEIGR
jgi:hypothetical protein